MTITNASVDTSAPRVKKVGVSLTGEAQYTTIQAAINAAVASTPAPSATAPYTVEIYPGIYNEAITMATWVNLKGIGPKSSVVISQVDATIITLATQVQIENLTVRLVTPSAGNRNMISDNAVACICRFTNVIAEITTPGGFSTRVWAFTGASTVILEQCSYNLGNIGVTGYGIYNITAGATISLIDCDFSIASVDAAHISGNVPTVFNSSKSRFAGTAKLVNVWGGGIYKFSNDAIICTGAMSVGAAIVIVKSHFYHDSIWLLFLKILYKAKAIFPAVLRRFSRMRSKTTIVS